MKQWAYQPTLLNGEPIEVETDIHDIGELAAEHGGMGDMETLIEGSRVRFGRVTHDDEKGGKEYFL